MNSTVHVRRQQEERVIQEAQQEPIRDDWEVKLRTIGVDTGVSLSDEATRRDSIYED